MQVVHAQHAEQHRVAHARGARARLGGGAEEEAYLLLGGGGDDAPLLRGVLGGIEDLLLLDRGREEIADALALVIDDRRPGDDAVAAGTASPGSC